MTQCGSDRCLILLIMSGVLLGETLKEAFASGTLVHKGGGVVCLTPGKRYEQNVSTFCSTHRRLTPRFPVHKLAFFVWRRCRTGGNN